MDAASRLGGSALERALAGRIARLWNATLHGAEHVPIDGGALLVGNHAFLGLDSPALGSLLVLHTGRSPRWLAERVLFKLPSIARALRWVGAVEGEREHAVRLLREGELVIVYPGGIEDSFKSHEDRYRLQWGERVGFAVCALEAGVPILPVAATGVDDVFEIRGRERWFGRRVLGSPHYDLPILRRLRPKVQPLEYWVLPPIPPEGSPRELRDRTQAALESVLEPFRSQPKP